MSIGTRGVFLISKNIEASIGVISGLLSLVILFIPSEKLTLVEKSLIILVLVVIYLMLLLHNNGKAIKNYANQIEILNSQKDDLEKRNKAISKIVRSNNVAIKNRDFIIQQLNLFISAIVVAPPDKLKKQVDYLNQAYLQSIKYLNEGDGQNE